MEVNLEVFSGPLDLLLTLIRRREINIYDIPIAAVTEEYLEEIKRITPDMGEMSEFLVLASTLLEIKSNMLLPRSKNDEDEVDPREALVRKLIAYEEAQELARILSTLTPVGEAYSGGGEPDVIEFYSSKMDSQPVMDLFSLSQLAELFGKVMKLKEGRIDTVRAGYGQMSRDKYTVTEKIGHILENLEKQGKISLFSLFNACRAKRELVVTFLAVLEMMRRGLIRAIQSKSFEDVEVLPCPGS